LSLVAAGGGAASRLSQRLRDRVAARAASPQVADLGKLLEEKDACGVGLVASLKGTRRHDIVTQSLDAVGCMEHRGACSADNVSGDGTGVMTEIPWKLIQRDFPAFEEGCCGVGQCMMPQDPAAAAASAALLEEVARGEGFEVLGWREVPVDASCVGRQAEASRPGMRQVLLKSASATGDDLERKLFLVRRMVEARAPETVGAEHYQDFFICTLSSRTIVYKGMLNSSALGIFFKDLVDPDYESLFSIYHRRFSTNTVPKWPLAQPFRFLGHNGEINTLQGNINWQASIQGQYTHPVWDGREEDFGNICDTNFSDSANLDRVAELMVRTGFGPDKAMMLLVPEAYKNHPDLEKHYAGVGDFYNFFESMQEGWDGPALLVFSDGKKVGAKLDRNGLRPARYWADDDTLFVASEMGVLGDQPEATSKGRLGPGEMVLADLQSGKFLEHPEIAKGLGDEEDYAAWNEAGIRPIETAFGECGYLDECQMSADKALQLQNAFGYGQEDSQMILTAMASDGQEATYCMGDDTPLAFLSERPHMVYDYFKQRFAQVTNPPIDPLREGLVMSLSMRLGRRGNILEPGPDSVSQVQLSSPVLLESELEAIQGDASLATRTFPCFFDSTAGPGALKTAILKLCEDVEQAVREGCQCVVLSDRPAGGEVNPDAPAMPMLLAVGAVHHHLIQKTLRGETSIVSETAQCFSTHHIAVLVGYGVHAVCPYLALEAVRQWRMSPNTEKLVQRGKMANLSMEDCQANLCYALNKGLRKILSKMGISLLSCYHGAQILEAYGLGLDVIDLCFKGSVSRIGGLSLDDLAEESATFWRKYSSETAAKKLDFFGFLMSKPQGEYHENNAPMSKLLHKAIGLGGGDGNPEAFEAYEEHLRNKPIALLRDMLEFKKDITPIPIEEVEPAADIVSRFCTGGMSLGAISQETHECIAIAMNRIGGKSNSGEGGEDPKRWEVMTDVQDGTTENFSYLKGLQNGDIATSAIKQVASGRFGVTPHFLVNADQLEIKVAQGAKPGEGGQLPGKKVSPYIASLRRSKPGVTLISPPPHHDIYSIEDLAQLIWDLHQVNERAKVSVKLVAEAGIGTVASGVAKANADIIQVSGHDGGTGASPVSSIKHAGGPIEMGLVETHRTLLANELRERVIVRADGGLRTGRDVLMMSAMGADEFGFGTTAMIATGCVMARICHTNNCPVGVATQREDLRKKFPGTPDDLVNFFLFVAEEVRAGLASVGLRSLDELCGRSDLLQERTDVRPSKTGGFDSSFLTEYIGPAGLSSDRIAMETHSNGDVLDNSILEMPGLRAAIEKGDDWDSPRIDVVNIDRALAGRVAGAVAKPWGDRSFPGQITLNCFGSGGQSAGCFLVAGVNLNLEGEANDGCGKGMAGGSIALYPPKGHKFAPEDCVIVGNTALYGATGGKAFLNGRAGERFCVRNSMAEAVVEGTGDHCCEYMTGGAVVVLGKVGRNVGAGMTGGMGYFLDEEGNFPEKVNSEIVSVQRVVTDAGAAQLRSLIEQHVARTGSPKGQRVLGDWAAYLPQFWQVVPPSEQDTPEASDASPSDVVEKKTEPQKAR
jgi:glutamate synthase (ferredoxin)